MEKAIGAMWEKKKKNGETFFAVEIEQTNGQKLKCVAWLNDKGDNPKRPDYRIFLDKPRDGTAF